MNAMHAHGPPPTWVYLGGFALTVTAGVINAVGFLGYHHQSLSHMTGTVTILGIQLVGANYASAWHAFAILSSFFIGCIISGAVIRQESLRLGRRYGVALSLESCALFLAVFFIHQNSFAGDYLAALACGLQNAMVTTYSGSTMRTSHMTGMITDLGIACGHVMRGSAVDWFRFRIYGVLLLGFFAGGVVGTMGFDRFGANTLLVPAVLSGVTGVGYTVVKHRERRKQPSLPI